MYIPDCSRSLELDFRVKEVCLFGKKSTALLICDHYPFPSNQMATADACTQRLYTLKRIEVEGMNFHHWQENKQNKNPKQQEGRIQKITIFYRENFISQTKEQMHKILESPSKQMQKEFFILLELLREVLEKSM